MSLSPPHFLNWQQESQGSYLARVVFPEKARELRIDVDLVTELTVINPFDFFLEPSDDAYQKALDGPSGPEQDFTHLHA